MRPEFQEGALPPPPPGCRHLNLVSRCVVGDDTILDNIRHSITLGLPEFGASLVRNNGDFIICGSGPSIEGEIESLRQWKKDRATICSLNDAHDWLVDHGIIPDLHLMLDPTKQMAERVKKPQHGVVYLIASQCHSEVFERLSGYGLVIWHALALLGEEEILGNRMRIGGGVTVGLRALNFGYMLGFHKFHLYGYDSCLSGDRLRVTGEGVKNGNVMEVICGGRKFYANPAMAGQANDVSQAIDCFNGNIRVKAYGDGLLQHVLNERTRLGHSDW